MSSSSQIAALVEQHEDSGPVYLRIAAAIASGVADGRLRPGERLPGHRSLAAEIKVAVPTVTRAYRETERRGITTGTVGRGTFVAGIPRLVDHAVTPGHGPTGPTRHNMAINAPARGEQESLLRASLTQLGDAGQPTPLLQYQSDIGSARERSAALRWLAAAGVTVDPATVAVTHGGQHAILVSLAAACRPGQVLLTEALTYPGVLSAAQVLGLSVDGVRMDAYGMVPESLDAACGDGSPIGAVYLMPTAHNPTAITMPDERRHEIVEVARSHDLVIIEDDVFGQLSGVVAPQTLKSLAPERTIYLTSLSKTLGPGLRYGMVAAPPSYVARIGATIRATIFNPSPISSAVAVQWLEDGTAESLLEWQRAELALRFDAVKNVLDRCQAVQSVRVGGLHAWVELASPWTAAEAVEMASSLGIDINPTVFFCANNVTVPRAVRLCLGNAIDADELSEVVGLLAAAWDQGPTWGSRARV